MAEILQEALAKLMAGQAAHGFYFIQGVFHGGNLGEYDFDKGAFETGMAGRTFQQKPWHCDYACSHAFMDRLIEFECLPDFQITGTL